MEVSGLSLTELSPLWWIAALVPIAAALVWSLVDRPPLLRTLSFLCRAIAIVLLALALARPTLGRPADRLHAAFLIDVSASVDLASIEAQLERIDRAIEQLRAGDTWSLAGVASEVRTFESTSQLSELIEEWRAGNTDDAFRSASDVAAALRAARLSLPADAASRVVLLTDGRHAPPGTARAGERDIADAVEELTADDQPVEVLLSQLAPLDEPEAAIASLRASPAYAHEGEVARLTARVLANRDMAAEVRIVHRGVIAQRQNVQLGAGEATDVHFDVPMVTAGRSVWTAEIEPQRDFFLINNHASATIRVSGQPRVLVLHREPREMRQFERAMTQQEIVIETRQPTGAPRTMQELLAFDAVVLADIPATELSTRQLELLRDFVADFGGGLAMFGSDNSFGLGGYYRTPVEEVLPLISRFEKEKEKPSLAMVLVIDKSGSMDGMPIALARQAAKAAVELLSPQDQIGVIGFDSQAFIAVELQPASVKQGVKDQIDRLQAGGGTFMYAGMEAGLQMLDGVPAKLKHMIVLGDGVTSPADHDGLVAQLVDMGVTVSTVALGGGADRALLSAIAERGSGRYYETLDPSTVPQIFTRETMQASRSAIKEDLVAGVQVSDHPMLEGFRNANLPFSLGYVMTQARPTARVLLATETGDPLLAVNNFGLGTSLAYTSDLTPKWGAEWLAWPGFGRFWAQTLRAMVRRPDADPFQIDQQIVGDDWIVEIRRPISAIMQADASESWTASLIDDQTGHSTDLEPEPIGVGRYRVRAPLGIGDLYTLRLHETDSDTLRVLHHTRSYPAEYDLAASPDPALARLQAFDADQLREELPNASTRLDLAPWLMIASILAFTTGLLLRRV